MLTFYLVRHAHSVWSEDDQRPLSLSGQKKAHEIATLLHRYPISEIYSSPYRRALESIQPLAHMLNIKIRTDERLVERRLGNPVQDFTTATKQLWDSPSSAFHDGESNLSAQARAISFLHWIFKKAVAKSTLSPHIVISTHGNLLCLILQHFYPNVDYAFWRTMTFPDIYTLEVNCTFDTKYSLKQTNNERLPKRLWIDAS